MRRAIIIRSKWVLIFFFQVCDRPYRVITVIARSQTQKPSDALSRTHSHGYYGQVTISISSLSHWLVSTSTCEGALCMYLKNTNYHYFVCSDAAFGFACRLKPHNLNAVQCSAVQCSLSASCASSVRARNYVFPMRCCILF